MYTGKAARFSFQEREIGDIEVGKRADLTVLSSNPYDSDIESIMDIEVEKTFYKRVIVYDRKEQQNAKRAGNRS